MPVRKGKKEREDLQEQAAVATSAASSSMFACQALLPLRRRGEGKGPWCRVSNGRWEEQGTPLGGSRRQHASSERKGSPEVLRGAVGMGQQVGREGKGTRRLSPVCGFAL